MDSKFPARKHHRSTFLASTENTLKVICKKRKQTTTTKQGVLLSVLCVSPIHRFSPCMVNCQEGSHTPERINMLAFFYVYFSGNSITWASIDRGLSHYRNHPTHDVLLGLGNTGQRWPRFWSPPIDSKLRTVLLESSGQCSHDAVWVFSISSPACYW